MARRDRRERRRAEAPPAAVKLDRVARPAPPPAQRGTFRVAQAQRQLAHELPQLVRMKDRRNPQDDPKRRPPLAAAPASPAQAAAQRTPPRDQRRAAAPLSLDKSDPRLKCRPKDSRAKSGGSGRAFVPWGGLLMEWFLAVFYVAVLAGPLYLLSVLWKCINRK